MRSKTLILLFAFSGALLAGAILPALAVPPPACDFDDDGLGDVVVNNDVHYGSDITDANPLTVPYFGPDVVGEGACGDFDGDGRSDLAISAFVFRTPTQSCNIDSNAYPNPESMTGVVEIRYGSASGLAAAADDKFWQGTSGIDGEPELCDMFGGSLATGDFDGDGFSDLAIGTPGEGVKGVGDAGLVEIIYGSASGLTAAGSQLWEQGSTGMPGAREAGDEFGWSLAAGDFNADGRDDLAIGVPFENISGKIDVGMVTILKGQTGSGLSTTGALLLHQGVAGVEGANEGGDRYAYALFSDLWNADARADLAVGVPNEGVGNKSGAGKVHVFFGSASGITPTGMLNLHQAVPGMPGTPQAGDFFGNPITSGDHNGDGDQDLGIAAPFDIVSATRGFVTIVPGSNSGPTGAGGYVFNRTDLGYDGLVAFPQNMVSTEIDGDAFADMVVGNSEIPATLISGSASGLDVAGAITIGDEPTIRLVG